MSLGGSQLPVVHHKMGTGNQIIQSGTSQQVSCESQLKNSQNLQPLQVNLVQQSQHHDPSSEVKMTEPVVTLYTSKNVQSPQKLVEQLAKEKGFMNSPIIIVENISKVPSATSMAATHASTMSTSQSPPNLYVSMPIPESSASQPSIALSQEVHKCEECEYTSHNKHYLKQHVDLVHCANRPYKCPFCNYAGKRSHSLREHLMVHSNERPFVCNHCHATFRKKGHLTNHIKLHQKLVTCPICKIPVSQTLVEPHMKTVHQVDKLYVCDVCNHMAVNKKEIEEHLKSHKNQVSQTFVCEMCNHRSTSFELFCAHAEIHRETIEAQKNEEKVKKRSEPLASQPAERKMMKCSECGFVSGDITQMKEHMVVHIQQEKTKSPKQKTPESRKSTEDLKKIQSPPSEGSSTYKCVECEFSCTEAYVFVVHMLTHRPDLQIQTNKALDSQEQSAQQHLIMNEMVVKATASEQKTLPKTIKLQKIPKSLQETDEKSTAPNILNTSGQIPIAESKSVETKSETTVGVSTQVSPGESLPFIYSASDAKFRCTVCGYTCDYQRTIKAHIWKHSGNKNIDYPIFQNGPLSIYEEAKVTELPEKRVPALQNKKANNVQISNANTLVVEKVQQMNKISSVSPVAPVLANMLAMRAKQKDGNGDFEAVPIYSEQTMATFPGTREVITGTALISNVTLQPVVTAPTNEVSVYIDTTENHATVGNGDQMKMVVTLEDYGKIKAKNQERQQEIVIENLDKNEGSNTYNQDKSKSIDKTEECTKGKHVSVALKAPPSTTRETENLKRQMNLDELETNQPKRFCREESKNVVVETVDNSNLISYTSIKSQQNSPQAVSEFSQSEQSDSGVGSDTNTVVVSKNDKVVTETVTKSDEHPIFQDFGTEVTVSSLEEYETNTEEIDDTDNGESTSSNESDVDYLEDRPYERKRKRFPSTSMTESAVTLLSLLKKGPNPNPACPTPPKSESDNVDFDGKPKQGISSSLLAVIEQLRERSKNEAEFEDLSGGKKANKKRNKRELLEDLTEIENMGNVERIEEDGEVRFRCKLCHYSNISTFVIKQHMRLHKTKQPFECSLCEFIATSSESLQDHMIQHCKVRTYQCKLCSSAFNYKSQLRAHMRAHSEKEVFVCDDCEYETTNPVSYRNHVRGHNEKKQYICEVCDRKFISKYELKNHKKQFCSYQKSFQCDECDFVAIGPQEQKQHAKIHNKEFKCAKCDYNTTSITRFENHAKIHDEPKTLKCELCDFPAVSNRSLKSHMKRHINDQRFVQQPLEQYKCNICGYVCHHLPSLKSHMWRHASDQNYSYEFTNEVINAAIDYDSRLDTYEWQKEDISGFYQTIRQKLKDRLEGMNATGDPQSAACWVTFRCCQCGFETINKAELNVHMKSHSDIIKWTLQVNDKQKKDKG